AEPPFFVNFGNTLDCYQIEQPEAQVLIRHLKGFGTAWGFGIRRDRSFAILVPIWFPIAAIGMGAVIPWLPYRFSVRTLLILTTLLALTLGLIYSTTR